MVSGERDVIAEEEGGTSRFSTFVSILIALVSVLGAIVAWRVAVASSEASSADTHGLLVEVDSADVQMKASLTVLGHKSAYVSFVAQNSLRKALNTLGTQYETWSEGFYWGQYRSLRYLQVNYLDRNDNYNAKRDQGETEADYALKHTMDPKPLYEAADLARSRALFLLVDLIWLSGALVALTLADAIHHPIRYFFLLAGIGLLFTGSLAAVLIERLIA